MDTSMNDLSLDVPLAESDKSQPLRILRTKKLTLSLPGFGSAQNSAFGGSKQGGFGSTTTTAGGGLFGSGTATSGNTGFGGFGSTAPSTTSAFGSQNTGGGLFGNKPGFGSGTTTTSNPFGSTTSSTPFGSTTTGAFGAPASTALAANTGECQGTGSVPFQPFIEKEPNSSTNQQNSFQSISFQQPYQKFSPEELRLADYAQGRRYGNQSNQPGAFGSSNFGSFGQAQPGSTFGTTGTTGTTNPFGSGATGSGFGTSQPQTSAFGSGTTTSGGLFGQKPPSGGLFGSQQTQTSTGLFGSGSGGFGSGTSTGFGTNNQTSGTSVFGGNTAANKPTFSFGSTAPASSGTGFGSTTATTGAFGSGGMFGNTGQQQNTTTPFGQQPQQQQPAQNNPFGGFGTASQPATTSLFAGANQQKPATGLFGNTNTGTGTGLFGNTQAAAGTSNPFGASTNTQNTGGLFGAPKAPATGTGLFGSGNTAQTNTGGTGLFGGFGNQNANQNQQPQQSTGIFGNLNANNQQKPPSLFSQQPQAGATSLFGSSGNQQQGGNLFGGLGGNQPQQQPQQAQNSLFGGSLFGGSQQSQQNQQPQSLTASINDSAAYGNGSLFSNLASSQISNPGPLATPLSSSAKQKKTAALPLYKLNSASTSRFSTPTRRGFGFSYSNYGTPNSVSSAASTPGATFSGSLLGNNMGRSLGKSVSSSSLRRSFNAEDSILAPGAFSASPCARHYGSTGSMKKLVINRSLRSDLFSPPKDELQQAPSTPNGGILKKRVSFDSSAQPNGNGTSSPLKHVQNNATPSSEELGYMRPRPTTNGTKTNGTAAPQEMEQVSNNELAIVHEEEAAPAPSVSSTLSLEDQEPGQYWMKPSKAEIEAMTRDQRKEVHDFTVGRDGVGHVTFSVVDLRDINLDELFDNIVVLTVRSATVYPNAAKKPPRGKGLNVPSTISLQNSWPRGKDKRTPIGEKTGPRLKKHIDRLQKVPNTRFVNYEKDTGVWTFQVDHFTTYALDLDDDETDAGGLSELGQSTLSAPPDTPTPKSRTPVRNFDASFSTESQVSRTDGDPDDTFQFKRKKVLPGAFDDAEVFDEEMEMEDHDEQQPSFLDERSVGSQSEDGVEEPVDNDDVFVDEESVSIVDQEMAGSFPHADNTTDRDQDSQDGMDIVEDTPGGVMRARMRALKNSASPVKRNFTAANDWASTLTTTISPQKQDRALLKSLIDGGEESRPNDEAVPARNRVVSDGRGFATSIDLMNSLFGQTKSPVKAAKVSVKSKGFEVGVPS
jgi:nuclear pore complex protein Nup98-Nup96